MAKVLDQIIVVDIESTCWEGAPPEGEESEIIEIGICMLRVADGERLAGESIIVKPSRSTVSDYCTKLTTLTQAQVDQGISFEEACGIIKTKFKSKDRVWASYGDYDRRQFERQCNKKGDSPLFPFGPTHINVKNLFAVTSGLDREVGMERALEILKIPLEGTHHRGADDAWNIAAILSKLILAARATLI